MAPMDPWHQSLQGQLDALGERTGALEGQLAELVQERRELARAVTALAGRLAEHGLLAEEDEEWIERLLPVGAIGRAGGLKQATAVAAHRVIGKLRCRCGATVDDVEGVTAEICPWCGESLRSAR